jgi:hypothetical protein
MIARGERVRVAAKRMSTAAAAQVNGNSKRKIPRLVCSRGCDATCTYLLARIQ